MVLLALSLHLEEFLFKKQTWGNGCRIYVDIMTGEIFCQFRLLFLLSFIGLYFNPIGGEGMGLKETGNDHYFSQLQDSLY